VHGRTKKAMATTLQPLARIWRKMLLVFMGIVWWNEVNWIKQVQNINISVHVLQQCRDNDPLSEDFCANGWDEMDVTWKSIVLQWLTSCDVPAMVENGFGRVINYSSIKDRPWTLRTIRCIKMWAVNKPTKTLPLNLLVQVCSIKHTRSRLAAQPI
jgi:hypothetical protein